MSPVFGRNLWGTRPKTDYERWLEIHDQGFEAGDSAQYHPPAPDNDGEPLSDQQKQPHGEFLHHAYHHQSDDTPNHFFDNPHSQLPDGLRGPPSRVHPRHYETIAMQLGLLTVVILLVLRLIRTSRTQPLPSPRLPQVEGPAPDTDKKHLV